MKEVKKVWGKEIWVINRPEYCGKILILDEGAESSLHYHKKKTETFFCIEGLVHLTVKPSPGTEEYTMTPFSEPQTIEPGQRHKFKGILSSVIVEFSTTHDDQDVYRLTESKPGKKL